VVADEGRKLAERSPHSSKKIADLIRSSQKSINVERQPCSVTKIMNKACV